MTAKILLDQKQKALQTFLRDLPQLWQQRPREWVAYPGDQQLGFAVQKHELYQQCIARGLERDEFVVFCIEAQENQMTLGPVVLD